MISRTAIRFPKKLKRMMVEAKMKKKVYHIHNKKDSIITGTSLKILNFLKGMKNMSTNKKSKHETDNVILLERLLR